MREHDVIVIGGGLSGLMAAAAAAARGKKTMVIAKGAGTLAVGGGTIDVLGCDPAGRPLAGPGEGMAALPGSHPYRMIGESRMRESFAFFLDMCKQCDYPYSGDLSNNQWVPTAAGTRKPTCFVPETMKADALAGAERIVICGFTGLKDFYPQLIMAELENNPCYAGKCDTVMVNPGLQQEREVTALDMARWLDAPEGRQELARQLAAVVTPGSVVLLPPVLGTEPSYAVIQELEKRLGVPLVETAAMPPAVVGLRLYKMMMRHVKAAGVTVMENAMVAGADIQDGRCRAVLTENFDRRRRYGARSFILATGGFYGGGIAAGIDRLSEPVFNLPVYTAADREAWAQSPLFANRPQPFALSGIRTDSCLRPVDEEGKVLLHNVHVTGRNLAHYDFCFEKSGNGVAIASGYHAGMSAEEAEQCDSPWK